MKAFQRYAVARFLEKQRDNAYRFYLADCLRIISQNTANYGGGSYINQSLADILTPKPKDDRSGEEIAYDVIKMAGIEVIY